MRRLSLGLFLLAFAVCGRSGTEVTEPSYQSSAPGLGKVFVVNVDLPHNPLLMYEIYRPLIDYLNRNVPGASFRLETSPNYEEFTRKLHEGQFDFALANGHQTLNALHLNYHVIAKMADDSQLVGVILVRHDSGIQQVADLKGKKVAYPRPYCMMGTIMPQYYLHTHGLDIKRDIENLYVGSHQSSIMNVYLGNVAAAGVRRPSWELFKRKHPDQARELVAQWETEPLSNVGVVARDDVPPQVAALVAQLLNTLHTTEEGRTILARIPLSRFELADDAHYRELESFLHKVYRAVRPLEEPCP